MIDIWTSLQLQEYGYSTGRLYILFAPCAEIAGTQEQVTVAKSLITIAMELMDERGGGDRER